MGDQYVFCMLDDAITLLPEAKLRNLVENYLDATAFCADRTRKQNLLADAKAFQKASLSGSYYNGSAGRGKNRDEDPIETLSWIADCRRLHDRCAKQQAKRNATEVCQAFEIVFGLLDHIDAGHDDVVAFADEGGSCQMGFDWEKVLPAWFSALSATVEPADYARRIDEVLNRHCAFERTRMLAVARNTSTPAQRQALPKS
ncbi:MAG: hypothetical protein WCA21_02050 [Terracidiphilus sp.]